jgi:hypothetical protein
VFESLVSVSHSHICDADADDPGFDEAASSYREEVFADTHEPKLLPTWSLKIKLRIGHIELLDAEGENLLLPGSHKPVDGRELD